MGLPPIHTLAEDKGKDAEKGKDVDKEESEQGKVTSPLVTSTTSRALLHVPDRGDSSLPAGLLFYGNGIGQTSSSSHGIRSSMPPPPPIGPVPESAVLSRLRTFLPEMQQANQRLQEVLDRQSRDARDAFNIEVLSNGSNSVHVEMDLALGIAELRSAEAVAAAERLVNGNAADRHRTENAGRASTSSVSSFGGLANGIDMPDGMTDGIRGLPGGGLSLLNGIGNGVIWEADGGSSSSSSLEGSDDEEDEGNGEEDGDNSNEESWRGDAGERESESESEEDEEEEEEEEEDEVVEAEEEEEEQEEEEGEDDEDEEEEDEDEDDESLAAEDGSDHNSEERNASGQISNDAEGTVSQQKEGESFSDASMESMGNGHSVGGHAYGNGNVKHGL